MNDRGFFSIFHSNPRRLLHAAVWLLFLSATCDSLAQSDVERNTYLGGHQARLETGSLGDNGIFLPVSSQIGTLTDQDIALLLPISGRTITPLIYFTGLQSAGLIPNWVRSDNSFSWNFLDYVIVGIRGISDPNAPTITSLEILPLGAVNADYSYTLTALEGTPPYTWTLIGSLPNGLILDPVDGIIEGTPTRSATNTFTIRITDSKTHQNDKSFTIAIITAGSLPNLVPYTPTGWSDRLVISVTPGDYTDAAKIYDNQDIYIDWAVANISQVDVTQTIPYSLSVDGQTTKNWSSPNGMQAGYYTSIKDFDIGRLQTGRHTIRLDVDFDGTILESRKIDNSYTKTITVEQAPTPALFFTQIGLAGTFFGEHTFFTVSLPPGLLKAEFSTGGGTGNCDLYVNYASQPADFDFGAFGFSSVSAGNNENIAINNPIPGNYYILVYAFTPYSGVTMDVSVTYNPSAPPAIFTPPQSQTVTIGATVPFTVLASGTPPLTYQWQFDGTNLPGPQSSSLILSNVTANQAGTYAVILNNAWGSITSAPAILGIRAARSNTFRFFAGTGSAGLNPFSLVELQTDPVKEVLIGPANYNLGLDIDSNGVLYGASTDLRIINPTNGFTILIGPISSASEASIMMNSIAFAPDGTLYGVSSSPTSDQTTPLYTINVKTAFATQLGTFPDYVWGIDFAPDGTMYGAHYDLFTLNPKTAQIIAKIGTLRQGVAFEYGAADIDFAPDGFIYAIDWLANGLYQIDPSNASTELIGTYTPQLWGIASQLNSISQPVPPIITAQPLGQFVAASGNVTFAVVATGTPPLTYQWQFNSTNLPGALNASLTLTNVTTSQAGNYSVFVSNAWGAITSAVVELQVNATNSNPGQTAQQNMALVPAGSFQMGDAFNGGNSEELPVHSVYVSAFYMEKYEVTKAMWDDVYAWATNHGYSFDNNGSGKATNHPVQTISWYDAVKWCNARSEKEGRVPAYYISSDRTIVYRVDDVDLQNDWVKWNVGYRLPTEAEWEKAARGGIDGRRFPWADVDTITHNRANYFSSIYDTYDVDSFHGYHPTFNDNISPYTSPVGYFATNGYGLYDMAGNVSEWCWDWWSFGYGSSPIVDPRGFGKFSGRIARGGNWGAYARYCRLTDREDDYPGDKFAGVGFRSILPSTAPDPIQVIATQTVQPTYGSCPAPESGKDSLILITHGWIDSSQETVATATAFVDSMSNSIAQYLTSNGLSNWKVFGYTWVDQANIPLISGGFETALINAEQQGKALGDAIVSQGLWTHIHFIAHSAGAGLIQKATEEIKTSLPSTTIHCTFLDAYDGALFGEVGIYGNKADWADSYFSRDLQTGVWTQQPLAHAYNVDVTQLDTQDRIQFGQFASTLDGSIKQCYKTESTHGWPITFYSNTIPTNVFLNYQGFGFPLSQEGGNWKYATNHYPSGNGKSYGATLVLGTPDPQCISSSSTPAYTGSGINFATPSSIQSITGTLKTFPSALEMKTDSPVWIATIVTDTNALNVLSFDAEFASATGSHGLLAAYWDTNIVGLLDEAAIQSGFHHYVLSFPSAAANTGHVLGFHLDPLTSVQSTITLTNIVTGFVGVNQPFSLSITTNRINGSPVYQLSGQAADYTVEASADLLHWSTVAILANNTGTVNFFDQNPTNAPFRFYRAVAQ